MDLTEDNHKYVKSVEDSSVFCVPKGGKNGQLVENVGNHRLNLSPPFLKMAAEFRGGE